MAQNEPKTVRITFKGVGPLTRSTIGNDVPDPDEQAISDTLHWIWSWQVQLGRFRQSTNAERSIDQAGQSGLECRKIFSRTSFDEHMLMVVGRNLLRAIDRLPKNLGNAVIPEDTREALICLRNIYEHWDEERESFQNPAIPKKRSGKKFFDTFPCGTPWTITYAHNDFYIGGVFGLIDFTKKLSQLETRLFDYLPVQET